ncbi:MAG: T9SS type A sorting domain-containing protein [Bacteroidota bacterium]
MHYARLDAGNVMLDHDQLGNLYHNAGGIEWKSLSGHNRRIVFDHGLNVIGKYRDTLRGKLNYWFSPFAPGRMIGGMSGHRLSVDDVSRYTIYKINQGDHLSETDQYTRWPADLGAPVDSAGRPRLYGDQMTWMVYNGASFLPSDISRRLDSTQAYMPLEIRQSTYVYSRFKTYFVNFYSDIVFMEWEIINRGSSSIDSLYLGFWTDIDFNDAYDNYPAVDTSLNLGYCWTPFDTVTEYRRPMAIGYALMFGPVSDAPGDTAVFMERSVPNKKNLPITSFWGIRDDSYSDSSDFGPPYSLGTAWNVARGVHQRGYPIFDSVAGTPTRFMYNGDPVTGTGWIYPYHGTSGGAGFLWYSGPVTMAPSDTQWMMIALIPSRSVDHNLSVTHLRMKKKLLSELSVREIRGSGFDWTSPPDNSTVPVFYELHQNFPNPFNPATTFVYDVALDADVEISVYSVLGQKITTLVNERKKAGQYSVSFDAGDLAGGVYVCRMKVGYLYFSRKMILLR